MLSEFDLIKEYFTRPQHASRASSIYVKEGFAYVLCLDEMERIGSSDITFNRPGAEGRFFRELENANGYELRAYCDQALFCYSPGKNSLITGIVN